MNREMHTAKCTVRISRRALIAAAFCALHFPLCLSIKAEVIDRVLATVNGRIITLSDVTAARDLGLVTAPPDSDPIRVVLSALIDRALELSEVDRYAPAEPSREAVDDRLQEVRGRF